MGFDENSGPQQKASTVVSGLPRVRHLGDDDSTVLLPEMAADDGNGITDDIMTRSWWHDPSAEIIAPPIAGPSGFRRVVEPPPTTSRGSGAESVGSLYNNRMGTNTSSIRNQSQSQNQKRDVRTEADKALEMFRNSYFIVEQPSV